ncbi:MAG: hypothetical protein MZU95_06070 [Desulfomicrobium escambiense]|nr:hypothetical protein [Desulfomicrobium escambiense]
MDFPEPVISVADRAEDEGRPGEDWASRSAKLAAGRPDLPGQRPTTRPGQTIISGMGELHLEIIVDRLHARVQGRARTSASPRSPTARRSSAPARIEWKFVRQSGGRGQYGHVWLKLEPPEAGQRASSSKTRSSADPIPREYMPAVEKGIREALDGGVLAGYPDRRRRA